MAAVHPGWLTIREAEKRYRVSYWRLWAFVQKGILTRGNFHSVDRRSPIYLKVEELEAWKHGGTDAVLALRGIQPAELGGEGGT